MLSPEEYQSLLDTETSEEEAAADAAARLDRFAVAALTGILAADNVDALKTKADVIAARAWYLAHAMVKGDA